MSDRIFGGIGLVLAVFFIWQATLIQESFISDVVGPKVFPIILAVLLGLSSLYAILKPDPEPAWPAAAQLLEIAMAAAIMVLYAIFLPELGFLISTAIAATYLTWRLGTAPVMSLVVGILTSAGIYLIFKTLLGLSLASGLLGL